MCTGPPNPALKYIEETFIDVHCSVSKENNSIKKHSTQQTFSQPERNKKKIWNNKSSANVNNKLLHANTNNLGTAAQNVKKAKQKKNTHSF